MRKLDPLDLLPSIPSIRRFYRTQPPLERLGYPAPATRPTPTKMRKPEFPRVEDSPWRAHLEHLDHLELAHQQRRRPAECDAPCRPPRAIPNRSGLLHLRQQFIHRLLELLAAQIAMPN